MLAEVQENKALHLAFLSNACCLMPSELKPEFGPVRIPDFKELLAKVQAEMPQVPQRRVFSPSDLETKNSKPETLSQSRLSELLTIHHSLFTDVDPIYTYDLNGNRTSMIDPTGLTTTPMML